MTAFLPLVKVVDVITGTTIMNVPGFYSLPNLDNKLGLSLDGGPPATYEVKGATYVIDAETGLPTPEGVNVLNYTVRVEVQVQE